MNRRTVAGVCLIAAPLVHLASCFFWPAGSEGSAAEQVATAAAHPGAITAAAVADAASWVLLLPALVVLWQEVRGRGAALVSVGVWGTVLGVLGYAGGTVLTLVTVDLGRAAGGSGVYEAVKQDGTITAVVVLPILLGMVALVVLLAGAARAGLGGWWLPVAGMVSVIADQLTAEVENPFVLAASFLPMAVALGYLGRQLLQGSAPATTPASATASTVAA